MTFGFGAAAAGALVAFGLFVAVIEVSAAAAFVAVRVGAALVVAATAGFAAIMVWMYWTSLTILIGAQVGRSARDVLIDNRAREMVEGDI